MPSLDLVMRRWGTHRCIYCDGAPESVDHIFPRRLAKRKRRPHWMAHINDPANLAPCCTACNQAKGGMDVRTFLADDPARLRRIFQAMARLNPGAAELVGGWVNA